VFSRRKLMGDGDRDPVEKFGYETKNSPMYLAEPRSKFSDVMKGVGFQGLEFQRESSIQETKRGVKGGRGLDIPKDVQGKKMRERRLAKRDESGAGRVLWRKADLIVGRKKPKDHRGAKKYNQVTQNTLKHEWMKEDSSWV